MSYPYQTTAPTSVNFIAANSFAVAAPSSPPAAAMAQPMTEPKVVKSRSFRAKAKKALSSVKKVFKDILSPSSTTSDFSSVATIAVPTNAAPTTRTSVLSTSSVPSICITKPSNKISNVRYTIHHAPSTPVFSQVSQTPAEALKQLERPKSASEDSGNRKSMRFCHPVVSQVQRLPSTVSLTVSHSSWDEASRPSTVSSMEFAGQVNPKRVFRNSHVAAEGADFRAFKDVMDGMKTRLPTRPAAPVDNAPPAVQVGNTPPSLPFIAMVRALVFDDGNRVSRGPSTGALDAAYDDVPAAPVPTNLRPGPTAIVPATLRPGSMLPTQSRDRPHTTGELLSGTQFLPYIPFNPRFNPYETALAPTPDLPTSPASSSGLAAAFEEAEAEEQIAMHKRHTRLYQTVEMGLFSPLPAQPQPQPPVAVAAHQIKRKAIPGFIAGKPAPAPSTAFPKPWASKPLPDIPAPGSPRRFTRVMAPPPLPRTVAGSSVSAGRKPSRAAGPSVSAGRKPSRDARPSVSAGRKPLRDARPSVSASGKAAEDAKKRNGSVSSKAKDTASAVEAALHKLLC